LFKISHIKGHIAANYIGSELKPPYLCLLASGGHTAIVNVVDYEKIELICQSRDDACGEAFDKIARVLGLPYPGGPEIQKLAKEGNPIYDMPKPKFTSLDDAYFSYSGLKTFVINLVHNAEQKGQEINKADVACSFQKAAVSQLVDMLKFVSKEKKISKVAIAGGVSANEELRSRLDALKADGIEVYYPKLSYCTDNAAMIGAAANFLIRSGECESDLTLDAKATVPLR